jgi:hypothetical protein
MHFHCWVIDHVFATTEDEPVYFTEASAPDPARPHHGAAAGARSGVALVCPRPPSRFDTTGKQEEIAEPVQRASSR